MFDFLGGLIGGIVELIVDLFVDRMRFRHFVWLLAAIGVLILLVWLWLERSR